MHSDSPAHLESTVLPLALHLEHIHDAIPLRLVQQLEELHELGLRIRKERDGAPKDAPKARKQKQHFITPSWQAPISPDTSDSEVELIPRDSMTPGPLKLNKRPPLPEKTPSRPKISIVVRFPEPSRPSLAESDDDSFYCQAVPLKSAFSASSGGTIVQFHERSPLALSPLQKRSSASSKKRSPARALARSSSVSTLRSPVQVSTPRRRKHVFSSEWSWPADNQTNREPKATSTALSPTEVLTPHAPQAMSTPEAVQKPIEDETYQHKRQSSLPRPSGAELSFIDEYDPDRRPSGVSSLHSFERPSMAPSAMSEISSIHTRIDLGRSMSVPSVVKSLNTTPPDPEPIPPLPTYALPRAPPKPPVKHTLRAPENVFIDALLRDSTVLFDDTAVSLQATVATNQTSPWLRRTGAKVPAETRIIAEECRVMIVRKQEYQPTGFPIMTTSIWTIAHDFSTRVQQRLPEDEEIIPLASFFDKEKVSISLPTKLLWHPGIYGAKNEKTSQSYWTGYNFASTAAADGFQSALFGGRRLIDSFASQKCTLLRPGMLKDAFATEERVAGMERLRLWAEPAFATPDTSSKKAPPTFNPLSSNPPTAAKHLAPSEIIVTALMHLSSSFGEGWIRWRVNGPDNSVTVRDKGKKTVEVRGMDVSVKRPGVGSPPSSNGVHRPGPTPVASTTGAAASNSSPDLTGPTSSSADDAKGLKNQPRQRRHHYQPPQPTGNYHTSHMLGHHHTHSQQHVSTATNKNNNRNNSESESDRPHPRRGSSAPSLSHGHADRAQGSKPGVSGIPSVPSADLGFNASSSYTCAVSGAGGLEADGSVEGGTRMVHGLKITFATEYEKRRFVALVEVSRGGR